MIAKKFKIAIIIPVHGQQDLLNKCLASLRETTTSTQFEIILVDDGSPKTLEASAAQYNVDHVIVHDFQKGFTAAINSGLEYVFPRCDACVLLNSDMQVTNGWLEALLYRWQSHIRCGIVSGLELSTDNPVQIIAGGTRPVFANGKLTNLSSLTRKGSVESGDWLNAEALEWVTFGVALISRACYEKVGMLDPDYTNYFSDADYCLRAKLKGFEIWYEPDCRVLHKQSASTRLYRIKGLMGLQRDREVYCEKWVPSKMLLNFEARFGARLQQMSSHDWHFKLVPHVTAGHLIGEEIITRITKQPQTKRSLKKALTFSYQKKPDPMQHYLLYELYKSGLAYIEIDQDRKTRGVLPNASILILAPHSDDAAISIGGVLLLRRPSRSDTRIQVIFGRSNFGRGQFAGIDIDSINRVRDLEEAYYCSQVGASFGIFKNPDRVLRKPTEAIYLNSIADVNAEIMRIVQQQVLDLIEKTKPDYVFAPLGAGLMADHTIVAKVVANIADKEFPCERIIIYEDLPYAVYPSAVGSGINIFEESGFILSPWMIDVSDSFEQKIEMIRIYLSQYDDALLSAVEAHAQALATIELGGEVKLRQRFERLWRVSARNHN